jgi:indolepyruvate ferredoxin oxidoreductase, beta subunit
LIRSYNIVVAGIGGQGVVSFTKWLIKEFHQIGLDVNSSIYKGGAQQLGTVFSQLRVIAKEDVRPVMSCDIPQGRLNALIVFEPNEGLRHAVNLDHGAEIYLNNNEAVFFSERLPSYAKPYDVEQEYDKLNPQMVIEKGADASQIKGAFQAHLTQAGFVPLVGRYVLKAQ